MVDLDNVLVPVIHAAANHQRRHSLSAELLFKVLRLLWQTSATIPCWLPHEQEATQRQEEVEGPFQSTQEDFAEKAENKYDICNNVLFKCKLDFPGLWINLFETQQEILLIQTTF